MIRHLLLFGLFINSALQAQHTYVLEDAPGSVSFSIRNFGIDVQGTLSGIRGEVKIDHAHMTEAYFNVSVAVKTIDTGISLRDKHLLKEDYFDVERYRDIMFISETVKPSNKSNEWLLHGNLTIKGITKSVSIPFRVQPLADNKLNFSGEFKINRRDYGVGSKSVSLSDEVAITLRVVANPQLF